jgi:hypothetical protein
MGHQLVLSFYIIIVIIMEYPSEQILKHRAIKYFFLTAE